MNSDLSFCWEKIDRHHHVFRVTRLFARQDLTASLLALHALLESVDWIGSEASNTDVARMKLEWWCHELLESWRSSRHPIVRVLRTTGARERLGDAFLSRLIDACVLRLDASPPADLESLRRICEQLFWHRIAMEWALEESVNARAWPSELNNLAQLSGLVQLLRESDSQTEDAFWWVPLDLLADAQLTRKQLAAARFSDPVADLMKRILAAGISWVSGWQVNESLDGLDTGRHRHLLMLCSLHASLLTKQFNASKAGSPRNFPMPGISEVFNAWRICRRLVAGRGPIR